MAPSDRTNVQESRPSAIAHQRLAVASASGGLEDEAALGVGKSLLVLPSTGPESGPEPHRRDDPPRWPQRHSYNPGQSRLVRNSGSAPLRMPHGCRRTRQAASLPPVLRPASSDTHCATCRWTLAHTQRFTCLFDGQRPLTYLLEYVMDVRQAQPGTYLFFHAAIIGRFPLYYSPESPEISERAKSGKCLCSPRSPQAIPRWPRISPINTDNNIHCRSVKICGIRGQCRFIVVLGCGRRHWILHARTQQPRS